MGSRRCSVAPTANRSSWTPHCCWETIRIVTRTICRSWPPRAGQEANRAADHFPTSPKTGQCGTWSPTPVLAQASTCGQIPVSVSPATSTTCPSHAQSPSRRAFAIEVAQPPARSPTRARRPTAHPNTGPTAHHCIPECRRLPYRRPRPPRCRETRARPTLRQRIPPLRSPHRDRVNRIEIPPLSTLEGELHVAQQVRAHLATRGVSHRVLAGHRHADHHLRAVAVPPGNDLQRHLRHREWPEERELRAHRRSRGGQGKRHHHQG